jgi:hypothetical protein
VNVRDQQLNRDGAPELDVDPVLGGAVGTLHLQIPLSC